MKKLFISICTGFLFFSALADDFRTEEEIKAQKEANAKKAKALIVQGQRAIKEKKVQEAFGFYLQAARFGNAEAQAVVGNCYLNGSWGVEKDLEKAKKWFHRAARQGNNMAQAQLSRMWGSGKGVKEKRPKKSARLNRKSQF